MRLGGREGTWLIMMFVNLLLSFFLSFKLHRPYFFPFCPGSAFFKFDSRQHFSCLASLWRWWWINRHVLFLLAELCIVEDDEALMILMQFILLLHWTPLTTATLS